MFQFNNDTEIIKKILFTLYNIVDKKIPKLNCICVYSHNHNQRPERITKNHMIRRLKAPTLSFTLRQNIMKLTGYKSNEETTNDVVTSRTKCYFCPSRKNRLTKVT